MTIKQAIIYNMVSAILAYFGLIGGILLGGSEEGRHYILSITAGLFLYVALADMVSSIDDTQKNTNTRQPSEQGMFLYKFFMNCNIVYTYAK